MSGCVDVGSSTRRIGGVDVAVTTLDAAVAMLERARDEKRTCAVAFLNAHLANCAAASPGLREALTRFLVFNDGIGVDLASRLLHGAPFPANMNGTDFVPAFLDRSRPGLRLFLLGAAEAVNAEAARYHARRWPMHEVVGRLDGYRDDQAAVAAAIATARPDVTLVAMGCPLQEWWLVAHLASIGGIGIGVGALFDYQTGRVPRAPLLVRRMRGEWLFRFLIEPRRLFRRTVVGNAAFVARTLVQWRRKP